MKTAIKALTVILLVCLIAPAMCKANFRPRTFAMKKWTIGRSFHKAGAVDFNKNRFSPRRYRPGFSMSRKIGHKFRDPGASAKKMGVRIAQRNHSWSAGHNTRRFNPNHGKFGRNTYKASNLQRKFTPSTIARAVNLW